MTRKELRKELKEHLNILMVARHYKFYSQEVDEIAAVMGMSSEKIAEMMDTPEWYQCCKYWGNTRKMGDFTKADRVWRELIEFDEHLYPTAYPEHFILIDGVVSDPHAETSKRNALEMRQHKPDVLIAEPFVVENLHDDQIRGYICEERRFGYTPAPYENQHLSGYYWWLYPNFDGGVFSKVFARMNVFGHLLCGRDEKTHLVYIRHGRLELTQNVFDDVVSVFDERLLVCL